MTLFWDQPGTMKKLKISNLGPIKTAEVTFGDLTILVGPQASGKSIFLQMVKLISDAGLVFMRLESHGYVWENPSEFLKIFLGEGMERIWTKDTQVVLGNVAIAP